MGAAAGLAELRGLSPLKPPVNSGARTARSASAFDVTNSRADKAVRAPGGAKRVQWISHRWLPPPGQRKPLSLRGRRTFLMFRVSYQPAEEVNSFHIRDGVGWRTHESRIANDDRLCRGA